MKITMLSEIDYAGSGHKLCEAISLYTDHDIRLYSGKYYNPFGHPDHSKWDRREVQQRIDNSDIVHLKGDTPPKDGYLGLKIMHKPLVVTVSGSHFRSKKFGGYAKYCSNDYKAARVRTAFTPDLCYKGFSDVWTPHPIDCIGKESVWRTSEPPLLMHIPSRREVKGTDFVYDIFCGLKEVMEVETLIIENMPFRRVIEERKRATIYFDQFLVGFYGNSAIEAMQYGIPVAAWIRPGAMPPGCPVITEDKDVDRWVQRIVEVLEGDTDSKSLEAQAWCNQNHSYQAVARQWDNLYDLVTI